VKYSWCFGGDPVIKKLHIGGDIAAGVIAIMDGTFKGFAIPQPAATNADGLGVSLDSGVYAVATPVQNSIIINPLAVYRGRVSGTAAGGGLLSAATKNVLTNTLASATGVLVTDAANSGSVELAGGTIFCLTGANAGLRRPILSYVAATSVTVTLQFPNAIAVGDKFVCVPVSPVGHWHNATTNLLEINGVAAVGAAVLAGGVDVELELPINSTNPEVYYDYVLQNHLLNPID